MVDVVELQTNNQLEDAFVDLWKISAPEPLTPYRVCCYDQVYNIVQIAVYLLIRCFDLENVENAFNSTQRREASLLLHELVGYQDLSFERLMRILRRRLPAITSSGDMFETFSSKFVHTNV
jgi:hypothetical protein